MLRTTLAGLRAHLLRLAATALAIVLGVGFVAGTLVFGDTATAALYDQFARPARHVDVAVTPRGTDTLPAATLAAVRAVPGVAVASGRMRQQVPLLDRAGRLVGGQHSPGFGLSVDDHAGLWPFDVTAGRAPRAPGEAALDTGTAADTRYRVGDTVTVLDAHQRRHRLRVVGLVSFGASKQYADHSVVVLTRPELVRLTGASGYGEIVATAAPGVPPARLAARVRAALPGAHVATGDAYRRALANDAIGSQVTPFLTALLVFAVIACAVSAFVIYNTFNILVAQRIQQTALLRCVGAGRGQVFGGVLVESGLVGLASAALGYLLGLGVAYGLFGAGQAIGVPVPRHALVLTATPVVVAVALGVLVTVGSALLPAWRATRVAPLAALRRTGELPGRRRGRVALCVVAALAALLGTGLTLAGPHQPGVTSAALVMVAGGIANFLAVLLLAPLFVAPLTALLGWLPGKLLGVPARLATANARRDPGRTAATTAALMVGVGLMSASAVALSTVQTTTDRQLAEHYPVDYVLTPGGGAGIPAAVARQLRAEPGLGTVASIRRHTGHLDGRRVTVATATPGTLSRMLHVRPTAGRSTDPRPGGAVVFTGPTTRGVKLGDRVTVTTGTRHPATVTVTALADGGASFAGDVVVNWADFHRLDPTDTDDMVLVKAAPGVGPRRSYAAVAAVTDRYPLVSVASRAEWRAQLTSSLDQLIVLIAALLAVAVVIALIGITNTLSLSVFERTRESALTRALGLTRGQLRATLLIEALLMGLIAAVVGTGYGILYGVLTTRVLFTGQVRAAVTIPVDQLLGYAVLAAAAATLAATLPARRAAATSIVAALADA